MTNKTIRIYIMITLITQLLLGLHAAIYVTYLISNNLSLFQISLMNFFFMLSVFLLEIPTGAIADLFGRKFSFILSNIISGCGFLIYSIADNFTEFIIAEIVIVFGLTLTSGAFKAWFVDSLKYYQYTGQLITVLRIEGRAASLSSLVGGLVGGYLGMKNLTIPFAIAGFGFWALALVAYIIMKEEYFKKKNRNEIKIWTNIRKIARDSARYGVKNHIIFMIVLITIIFNLAFQSMNMYWQPWFSPHIPGNEYIGYICAGIVLFAIIITKKPFDDYQRAF